VSLGASMLRAACKQGALWRARGGDVPAVSVNVSARQFVDAHFLPTVNDALAAGGLAADALQIEITESLLVGDEEYAIQTLRALAESGVRIAIDDFGTGYSSLSYLKRLPVHILKIDQSFIRDLTSLPDDAAIVRAIIAMARSLNLEVIAEGVQTNAQLEFLRAEGCNAVQGYLTGRPLAPAGATSFIEHFDGLLFGASRAEP
jgi:EAL domain-containing protein (putative c-di-GMP-specific phosphodiesterase class I)